MNKQKGKNENYLEKIPCRNPKIGWSKAKEGIITLEIENTGFFNSLAQKLFKKPKISYIHLDENGSFVWPLIDGERSIFDIGKEVKAHFGDKCEPLYERLSKFFEILKSYNFIEFK